MKTHKNQNGNTLLVVVLGLVLITLIGGFTVNQISRHKKSSQSQGKSSEVSNGSVSDSKTSSEDLQVKSDVSRITAGLNEYAANNQGHLPITDKDIAMFTSAELPPELVNPINKKPYVLVPTEPKDNEILYLIGSKCQPNGTYVAATENQTRSFILQAKLPSGKYYCQDV